MESRMVRVSIPTYTRLLEIAAKEACTIAEASLVLLKPTIKEVEKIKEVGKKIIVGECKYCGEKLYFNTESPEEIETLQEAFKNWHHTSCIEKAEAK